MQETKDSESCIRGRKSADPSFRNPNVETFLSAVTAIHFCTVTLKVKSLLQFLCITSLYISSIYTTLFKIFYLSVKYE